MQIDTGVLFPFVSLLLAAGTFFVGRLTAAKQGGRETGQVLSDLGYIKKGVEGLEKKMERVEQQYNKLETRVARLEECVKIYHKEELG